MLPWVDDSALERESDSFTVMTVHRLSSVTLLLQQHRSPKVEQCCMQHGTVVVFVIRRDQNTVITEVTRYCIVTLHAVSPCRVTVQ